MKGGVNLVMNNKYVSVKYNLLDRYFYEEIKSSSNILKYYDQILATIDHDLVGLEEDVFYMLYKHILNIEDCSSLKCIITREMSESSSFNKIRIRTVGSTFETYLCLKYIMDQLIIRIRGTDRIQTLRDLSHSLLEESNKDLYSRMIEKTDENSEFSLNEIISMFENYRIDGETSDTMTKFAHAVLKSIKDYLISFEELGISPKLMDYVLNNIKLSDLSETILNNSTELDDEIKSLLEHIKDNELLNTTLKDILDQIETKLDKDSSGINSDENNSKSSTLESDFLVSDDLSNAIDASDSPETSIETKYLDESANNNGSISDSTGSSEHPSDTTSESDGVPSHLHNESFNSKEKLMGIFDDELGNSVDHSVFINSPFHDSASISEEISGILRKFEDRRHKDSYRSNKQLSNIFNRTAEILEELSAKLISNTSEISKIIDSLNIHNILEKTTKKIDSVNMSINQIGITPHSLKKLSFDEAISLDKRLESSEFKKFIDKVGRKKAVAKRTQQKMKTCKDKVIDKLILSDDIDYVSEEELMNLSLGIFQFEWDFYDRFLNKGLLTYELVSNDSKGKGPIVLCYDGSGSMEGNKILETKAHIVAIIEIARQQKRNMVLIQFSSKDEPLIIKELSPVNVTPSDVFEIYDTFIRGGTDFEKPLNKALEYLTKSSYKEGDILFITDGFCEISTKFIDRFSLAKIQNRFKLYSIIIQGQTYHDYGDLGVLSDEVLEIKRSGGTEWNDKVSERIFSLI